jgi:hypothetical protein
MRRAAWITAVVAALALPSGAEAAPILGRTVVVKPITGKIRVKVAGTHRTKALTGERSIPTGSFVDATRGTVRVLTADTQAGKTQSGSFDGGAFVVRQERSALTTLLLTSTRTIKDVCGTAQAAASKPLPPKVIRALHGKAHGKFRTEGRYAAATVRGTSWNTIDRCDGTVTTSLQGTVESSTGTQTFQLDAGTSLVAYCFPPGSAFHTPQFCTAVIMQPANGNFGWGIGTRDEADRYDVCIRTPSGSEPCTSYPFTQPDATGLRIGAVVCQQGRLGGPGTYRVRWLINGAQVGIPLFFTATLAQPSFGQPCLQEPAEPPPPGG